jgi:DNA-binding CsgD family transcriptional regulator
MQWFRHRRERGRPRHPDVLTPAEWRVLEEVRAGRTNTEIAARLGISVNTVRYHISNMLAKLELRDRSALASWHGEPAEASRAALGRFALGVPLGWVREGSWFGTTVAVTPGLCP